MLSRQREVQLLNEVHGPQGAQAQEALVEAYLPMVESIARRLHRAPIDYDDRVQVGAIGLIKAIRRFASFAPEDRHSRLGAYAKHQVHAEMIEEIARSGSQIRLPRKLAMQLVKVKRHETHTGSTHELASALGMPLGDLEALLDTQAQFVSLNSPLTNGPEEGRVWIEDVLADPTAELELDAVDGSDSRLDDLLWLLTEEQAQVVIMRYGLEGADPMTLERIADELGTSRFSISRLLKKAQIRMAHPAAEDFAA